jgi:hypothetical protein
MNEKIYCGNAWKNQTKFGEITKLTLFKEDINKLVKWMKENNAAKVSIDILPKKEVQEGKPPMYAVINDYVGQTVQQPEQSIKDKLKGMIPADAKVNEDSDLPF